MGRALAVLLALCLSLVLPATTSAAPRLCQSADSGGFGSEANQPRPNGIGVTYLYAKLDGENWVEPPGVCVAITYFDRNPLSPYVELHLWSAPPGFYFDLSTAGIPKGTPIALGLSFPPNAVPVTTMGQWRDGVVGFGTDALAIQAQTAPWTYVPSAYNEDQTGSSGHMDCSQGSTTWESTFGGFIGLHSLQQDGTPDPTSNPLMGSYFEANSSNLPFPYLATDDNGNQAVQIDVEGCGDHDPATLEGHFAGFMAPPALDFLGIGRQALDEGSSFMSSLVRIRDALGGAQVDGSLRAAKAADLAFEPIAGVTFPAVPSDPGPLGLLARADFSYSKHRLDFRARKANVRLVRRCARMRARVVKRRGKLRCRPRSPRSSRVVSGAAAAPRVPR